MPRHLLIVTGPDQGRVISLPESDTLLIGRSRATEARLVDPHVSRVHCRVRVQGDEVLVTDAESAGGTFINGSRLPAPRVLLPGDVLRIGHTELRYGTGEVLAEADTLPPLAPQGSRPSLGLSELVGQTFGNFQIGDMLARGQNGMVFHALDVAQNQPVALKVLGPEVARDDEQRERFIRAMRTVLPLRHPNLVPVLAAGKSGPHCWLAMEYIEGENLAQVVQRAGTSGMLDWRPALRTAIQVTRALAYAHGQQIIHRNVTPMNILLRSRDRSAVLGDLMLAKALEGTYAREVTLQGTLLGDVNYLSPERTGGEAEVNGRSDLFSLGGVIYAVLTGRPPFADLSKVETLHKIRSADPAPPRRFQMAVPEDLEAIVLRLLAKRPEDRYPSAAAALLALEQLAQKSGVAA